MFFFLFLACLLAQVRKKGLFLWPSEKKELKIESRNYFRAHFSFVFLIFWVNNPSTLQKTTFKRRFTVYNTIGMCFLHVCFTLDLFRPTILLYSTNIFFLRFSTWRKLLFSMVGIIAWARFGAINKWRPVLISHVVYEWSLISWNLTLICMWLVGL